MRAINVNDFIFDLDRVKAIVNSDPKTVSLIEKLQYIINEYEKQHSIEAEPVRHGKWIRDDLGGACCSVCEKPIPCVEEYDTDEDCGGTYEVEIDETPYCPNCGAKMDLED